MVQKPLFVRAEWDEEVRVWVATSDDVPGLATEGNNLDELIELIKAAGFSKIYEKSDKDYRGRDNFVIAGK